VTCAGPAPHFDTVVLAGGSAARMGGADKPGMTVGATPLLVSAAQAAADAGTGRLIVVGPPREGAVQEALVTLAAGRPGWLACVREEPPGRGPVAGLRRGLAEVGAPWLALLAADLPFLTGAHLTALLTADNPAAAAGVVLTDAAGRPQWLASCWRTSSLRAALAAYDGSSLHGLLAPLSRVLARLDRAGGTMMPPWLDCDTPDDLAAARSAWLANAAESGGAP
jgi:molybdopterin-guanine dinucleotide biosynthesis protein A